MTDYQCIGSASFCSKRKFSFSIILLMMLMISGCTGYHDGLHSKRVDQLQNGKTFDVYANARCAHIASIFRPDKVKLIKAGIPIIVGGSYFTSEKWVRVTEPVLLTINQTMLQACIQLELGEITKDKYTELITANSARYISLLPKSLGDAQAKLVTDSANEALKAKGGEPVVEASKITAAADAGRQEIYGNPDEANAKITSVETSVKQDQADLAKRASNYTIYISQYVVGTPLTDSEPQLDIRPDVLEQNKFTYILFDHDSSKILSTDRRKIQRFVDEHCCEGRFVVYGFADSVGAKDYNATLSRLRSTAVTNIITTHQANAKVVQQGLGKTQIFGSLLADNRVVYLGVLNLPSE